MTPKDVIKNSINMCQMVLDTYLSDLNDKDLMVRVVPAANHIAWQLGHLIVSEHKMMTDAGLAMPDLPDGFAASYTTETARSNDPKKFHQKAQYLAWMSQQRAGTMAALDAAGVGDLDKATPEAMQGYAPSVGFAFNMIGIHLMMHAGQFVGVRRMLGKPVLM